MAPERRESGTRPSPEIEPEVYAELKAIAARLFANERATHTLQPTAIVHEAYLRLSPNGLPEERTEFTARAVTAMRRLLVDHARAHRAAKRGQGERPITLDDRLLGPEHNAIDLLALDEALARLADLHERQHRVVELRFFGGLTIPETAKVLGVGTTTVEDDWAMARAWLAGQLAAGEG